jgi:hypothetical protein
LVPERCGSSPDRKTDAFNNLLAELSREQTTLLTTMAHQLIRSLPRVGSTGHVGPSYGLTSHIGPHIADDDRVSCYSLCPAPARTPPPQQEKLSRCPSS